MTKSLCNSANNIKGITSGLYINSVHINSDIKIPKDTAVLGVLWLIFQARPMSLEFLIRIQGRTGHACIWAMPGGPVGLK